MDEALGEGLGVVPIAAVESGLPAAGLGFGKLDFAADAAEDGDSVEADLGGHLVHEAGDEEGDFHWGAYSPERGAAQVMGVTGKSRELEAAEAKIEKRK